MVLGLNSPAKPAIKPKKPGEGKDASKFLRKPGKDQPQSIEGNLKELLAETQYQDTAAEGQAVPAELADVDAPLVRLVNSLLSESVRLNASDIHIEPFENLLRIRFRIDGVLQEIQKVPAKLAAPILSRLKIMAQLDICEKRIPQDGSIRFRGNGVEADFRVSTLPSVFGEKAVMRVLGKTNLNNDLSKLHIPEKQLKELRAAISRPDGLVLVTGPTGSGKTTTLYAGINEVNDISVSVFTAEDPVEGTIPGVTQCQVNTAVGYTFAAILRSFLRQDPDVILVGEIRDQETAEISIKAALTGHLVLSTLHTNCSVATISRLLNMGIAPYLIASAVTCIVAQRLVRKICDNCKESIKVSPEMFESLGINPSVITEDVIYHGKGCAQCHNSGYKGRAALYEVLSLTDELRQLILAGGSKADLKMLARSQGMVTLRDAGIDLVRRGVTTFEEVLGVTNEDEDVAREQQAPAQPDSTPISPAAQARSITASPDPAPITQLDQVVQQAVSVAESASKISQAVSLGESSAAATAVKSQPAAAALKWKLKR